MKIKEVHADNYRNLSGIDVQFNETASYLIGENNLGKSNLLDLLNTIGNGWRFNDSDFCDFEKPIIVDIVLTIADYEIGIMGLGCSPADANLCNLQITQMIEDTHPSVINSDTAEALSYRFLKRLNITRYDTLKDPSSELDLSGSKKSTNILNFFIEKYIKENKVDIDNDKYNDLVDYLNRYFQKIKAFHDFNISASITGESKDLLSRMISLVDENNMPISNTGNGIQFSAMASLSVFKRILQLWNDKSKIFDELVIKKDEKAILQMILAIDEPEVHLHPYMQRSLLSYYKKILSNKDAGFLELLKDCFNIDGINGQLIIVTHSTDALIDDYRSIVRFYKDTGQTKTISGQNFTIDQDIEKHLLMHFPDIKEAFYSKCTIIAEGATEFGAIKKFAKIVNTPLDDYGICLIDAGGEASIPKIKTLLEHFNIPSVILFDKDVQGSSPSEPNTFYTNGICFEMDIVDFLINTNNHSLFRTIITAFENGLYERVLQHSFLEAPFRKKLLMPFDSATYTPIKLCDIPQTDSQEYKNYHFAVLYKKKGVIMGRIIGEELHKVNDIPSVFKNVIAKAVEVSTRASV